MHAGGPRILDDLRRFLAVGQHAFRHSRSTLTEYGNIASAVVLDALRRVFDDGGIRPGATGIVAGFGPGITAEMAVGSWVTDIPAPAGAVRGTSDYALLIFSRYRFGGINHVRAPLVAAWAHPLLRDRGGGRTGRPQYKLRCRRKPPD